MNNPSLPKEALTAYLYDVGALETAKAKIEDMQKVRWQLGIDADKEYHDLCEPVRPMERVRKVSWEDVKSLFSSMFGFAFLFFFVFSISTVIWCVVNHRSFEKITITAMIAGAVFGVLFALFFWARSIRQSKNEVAEQNRRAQANYLQEMETYRQRKQALKEKLSKTQAEQVDFRNEIVPVKEKITKQLKQEYGLDILPSKYQNREAVFVMYELFSDGRCDTIKEAVNVYEDILWRKKNDQYMEAIQQELKDIYKSQEELVSRADTLQEQTDALSMLAESSFDLLQASAETIQVQNSIIEEHARTAELLATVEFLHRR